MEQLDSDNNWKRKETQFMRNATEAAKVNKAVEEILKVFDAEKLSEEEMLDALKATEVTLGIKPPKPFHQLPMGQGPDDMPLIKGGNKNV
jgi:hypothetical protein